jgi:hypothetical protein
VFGVEQKAVARAFTCAVKTASTNTLNGSNTNSLGFLDTASVAADADLVPTLRAETALAHDVLKRSAFIYIN